MAALRSPATVGSAGSRQRVKSAGGCPRAGPMLRCQTAGPGDTASRRLVAESLKKIQRPKTVRKSLSVVLSPVYVVHSYATTASVLLLRQFCVFVHSSFWNSLILCQNDVKVYSQQSVAYLTLP